MTFHQLAFKNVTRNKRTYAAYFFSSMFSVMVFFVYAIFAFHPSLSNENLGNYVSLGMRFAESIIYVFSFFFVLYSMSTFLKSRKKEFGIFVIHGTSNFQLKLLVFLENMMIGFGATVSGIIAGLIFAKALLLIGENAIGLVGRLPFYFPWQAIIFTFIAFLTLFLFISLFTATILRGNKLIDLFTGSAKPKPEPKASIWLSLLAAVLLITGYVIALLVRKEGVFFAMIPVTIIVSIGTYFLFTQLSVSIISALKHNKKLYRHKTNMIALSNLAYRMQDNARIFFIVTIVSTVAFASIGTLVGLRSMMIDSMTSEKPYAFTYSSKKNNGQEMKHISLIEHELNKEKLEYKKLKMPAKNETSLRTGNEVTLVKQSIFNQYARSENEETVLLKGNETIYLPYSKKGVEQFNKNEKIILKESNITLAPVKVITHSSFPLRRTSFNLLVVPDLIYNEIRNSKEKNYYFFDVNKWQETRAIGNTLLKQITPSSDQAYSFSSLAVDIGKTNEGMSLMLFVGLFIGAVFFVAAGSFLYFRLYSDLDDDIRQYNAITKLGLTEKELTKVITTQLALLFFVPIIVATIHGAIALTALQHMFEYSLIKESTLVLGSFFLIQVFYFLFMRTRYIHHVKRALM